MYQSGHTMNKSGHVLNQEVHVKKKHEPGQELNLVPNVIVVQGRWWSKSMFRNAWLVGLSCDDAWTEAFVKEG